MPDRSSHQGLPEEWNHGSHAAPEPFAASNGYGAATSGSHRARPADGYGTGPNAAFGAAKPDPLRDPYGGGKTDAFGVMPGGTYGAGAPDPFGDAADPFGDAADPFGARAGDPFGPATTAAFAAVPADAATARPDAERPMGAGRDSMAAGREPMGAIRERIGERFGAGRDRAAGGDTDTRGFLGALFDFGFTSFVTPSVIKVLYMLIMIGTVVSALVFTIIVFKASALFGFLMLIFGDPLFILIVLAIYRIILEFFVVTFRVAEDVRALRERGDLN
jgi:hypothetical protein